MTVVLTPWQGNHFQKQGAEIDWEWRNWPSH